VVEEYVRTGEPVGSEKVSEEFDLGSRRRRSETRCPPSRSSVPDAPHTSRVDSTDLGYRRFVDSLPPGRLREAHRRAIADFFRQAARDMEEVSSAPLACSPR